MQSGVYAVTDIIFREYDIRGIVGKELHVEQVYDLARAIAVYFVEKNPHAHRVAIGMDVRTHSPEITQEIIKGILDSGLDVYDIGTCTSPMLYFATHTMDVDAGLMITASHNPKEYNGIKICLGTTCVWGKDIQAIKHIYNSKSYIVPLLTGLLHDAPIKESYITWLYEQFPHLVGLDMPMVFDCGNGAASVVMTDIVEKMQWKNAHCLYAEPDGTFPNHEADPIVEENMLSLRAAMLALNASVGMGFDGDADRMGAMAHTGELIPGDKMLAVFAQQIIPHIPNLGVVFDVNASAGLKEFLQRIGAQPIMSPCGHSIILEQMAQHNALLGGELSCHFFFGDRGFGFDDGIYAAFRLLEVMQQSGKTIPELLADFPKKVSSKQYRLPCEEDEKQILIGAIATYFEDKKEAEICTIDGLHITMPYGWGLIRASNTQSVICFRFESDTQEGLNRIKADFANAIETLYTPIYTALGIERTA